MDFPIRGYTVGEPSLLKVPSRWKGKRILLKLPAALMKDAPLIIPYVEEISSKEVLLSSRPSFGACDVTPAECISRGTCGVLDLGHAPMPSIYSERPCPFLSVPLRVTLEMEVFLNHLSSIPVEPSRVGLITTAQHADLLEMASSALKKQGFRPLIGRGGRRLFYPGQVLGCDLSSAKVIQDQVDVFLYIGSGRFHPRGVALSTGKRVLILDPLSGVWGEVEEGYRERFIRQRYAAMVEAKRLMDGGEKVGIYISELLGQRRAEVAEEIKRDLEERGVEALLLQSEVLSPAQARDLSLKVMVNTACPRITFDDAPLYREQGTILLTPWEVKATLRNLSPESYSLDEISSP